MGKLKTRGGKGPCQSADKVSAKFPISGCWSFSQQRGRGPPEGSAACRRKGSWGQRPVKSFGSGQGGWAEMLQQLVRASKSLDTSSVCIYLARDQAPSQLGLDQTHWVGCRKEWTLVTLVCALEQDKTQRTGAAICRAQPWSSGTVMLWLHQTFEEC